MRSWRCCAGGRTDSAVPVAVPVPVSEPPLAIAAHPLTHDILLGSSKGPSIMSLSTCVQSVSSEDAE